MKKCGAEFIGTFALVFAGTGAIIINETTGGAITHVGISLTFGLIVLAMAPRRRRISMLVILPGIQPICAPHPNGAQGD